MSGGTRTSGGGGGSGARAFAWNVPLRVRALVVVAVDHLAEPIPGERGRMRRVAGGMHGLQLAAGHDHDRTTRRLVTTAEEHGLMKRSGATHGRQVYVQVSPIDIAVADFRTNLSGSVACVFCGAATEKGQHCPACQPAFRRDRAWKQTALNLVHDGKTLPQIAAAVGHPLYPGPGDGPMTGVVANLLAEAPDLVPDAYRKGWCLAVGAEVAHKASVLTSRGRQRRFRREAS